MSLPRLFRPRARKRAVKTFATEPRAEPRRGKPCPLCGGARLEPLWDCDGFAFARCAACGLVQQDPQPEPAAVAARYGGEYLAYEESNQLAYRDLELLALADLRLEEAAAPLRARRAREGGPQGGLPRALDVGCATGALLDALRARGWQPSGVEICAPAAAYGRERYGLPIHAGDLGSAGFPDASFDLIHASHLIEHLCDPAGFLEEASRVMADDGILVLTTPNASGFQARLLGPDWRSAINDHLYLFSTRTLGALLAAKGFSVERMVTWGGWARGLRPSFLKPFLDRWAKRAGEGDVMAVLARKASAREASARKMGGRA